MKLKHVGNYTLNQEKKAKLPKETRIKFLHRFIVARKKKKRDR